MIHPSERISLIRSILNGDAEATSDWDIGNNQPGRFGFPLREAAVLVPLIERKEGLKVILTKRSEDLKHHAGQVSFPGGRVEPEDGGPRATALREAREEIGLDPDRVEILGRCPDHETATGFLISPFVGAVPSDFSPLPQIEEVDCVFEVPFDYLAEVGNYRTEWRKWNNSRRQFYAVNYKEHYIWGATALILYRFVQRLKEH